MPLILSIVHAHSGGAIDRREVTGRSFSIGRGPESDWVLPDPERVLSKRHCEMTAQRDGWCVIDRSSNGTALNGSSLDPDQPQELRDRDRLTVGAYEIEVRFADAPPQAPEAGAWDGVTTEATHEQRLTGDPFSMLDGDPLDLARPGVGLPADFKPLFADEGVAEPPSTAPNHVSDLHGNFQPPRPSLELLPVDWDADDGADGSEPAPQIQAPTPAATPPAEAAGQAGLAAFTAGAGIQGLPAGDPDAALRTLGAAFRAVVSGLRRMMIARAAVKGEFRIEQTMIRAAGNNPLKFSADDDDALHGLLGIGRHRGMGPDRALAETLRDMRLHELAVAAAMQQAVRDMLAELRPDRLLRDVPRRFLDISLLRRRRAAWDRFERQHAAMTQALSDDFDSVFGKSFMRAYEAALASIAAQETEDPS